jgi:exopolysaccharide production protein ExoQ
MFTKHTGKPTPAVNVAQVFAATEAARKSAPRSPMLSHLLAVTYIAITVLIMCYSSRFNVWPILLFLALWGSTLLLKGFSLLRPSTDMFVCIAMPLLCVASTAWSGVAGTTLYLGTAFLTLNLCILISCRCVPFRSLLYGLIIGILIALLITVLNGRQAIDYMTGTSALAGLFGSKNAVGLVAEIGILSAATLLLMPEHIAKKICFGLVPFAFFAYCLLVSRSGTSLVSLLAALSVMALVLLVTMLPRNIRGLVLVASLLILMVSVAAMLSMGGQEWLLKSLGKNTTLTGRTELWEIGSHVGWKKPLFGHGYSAFWVHGQPLAEQLWAKFYIAERTGFHFHNIYVQAFVDLGFVGLGLIVLLVAFNLISSLRACLKNEHSPEIILLLALSVMFAVRSWVEVDFFLGPFGLGTFLFYMVLPRLSLHRTPSGSNATL